MRMRIAVIALVLVAVGATLFWRFSRVTNQQEATIERLESEIRELRSPSAPPARGAGVQPEPSPVDPLPGTSRPTGPTARPKLPARDELAVATDPNRENYLAAAAAVDQLRQRVAEMQTMLDKITAENQRLAESEKELHQKLTATQTEVENFRSQAKIAGDRADRIDHSYRTLRDEARQSTERVSELMQWNREVEDVNRRRENYLNNILRRYREVTEQYRALASRLEHSRETPAAAPGELSRIQTAISMAEEDFRQLQALNAQAATLARKYRH